MKKEIIEIEMNSEERKKLDLFKKTQALKSDQEAFERLLKVYLEHCEN